MNANIIDQVITATKKTRQLLLPEWYLPNGTKNASTNGLDGASESCERWSKWCGALVIVCIIAEFIVAIIRPPYDLFLTLSEVPDAGVAVGIVGEVMFSMWNNRIQTELRKRSNDSLSDAVKLAGDANERAAEANRIAAEAQLELAKLKIRRHEQVESSKESIVDRLRPFPRTLFDVGMGGGDGEQADFVWRLEDALAAAGWAQLSWGVHAVGIQVVQRGSSNRPVAGSVSAKNVEIHLDTAWRASLLAPAEALISALNAAGIEAAEVPINVSNTNVHAMHILIGPKR